MRARLKVSRAGVELIKSFEGLRQTAARLPDGRWTLGYGHTFSARDGAKVTPEDAEALLRFDLLPIVDALNNHILVPLNQHQFDALVSFCFNIGVENFQSSNVLKRINEGRLMEAALSMESWRSAEFGGQTYVLAPLIRRRAAEKNLFLTPVTTSDTAPSLLVRPLEDAHSDLPLRDTAELDAPIQGGHLSPRPLGEPDIRSVASPAYVAPAPAAPVQAPIPGPYAGVSRGYDVSPAVSDDAAARAKPVIVRMAELGVGSGATPAPTPASGYEEPAMSPAVRAALEQAQAEAQSLALARVQADDQRMRQIEEARLREAQLAEEAQRQAQALAAARANEEARQAVLRAEEAARQELERQKADEARLEMEREQARLDQMRQEQARLEAQRLEAARLEAARLEAGRLESERLEATRLESERIEAERQRAEAARLEQTRLEQVRLETAQREAAVIPAAAPEAAKVEIVSVIQPAPNPQPDPQPEPEPAPVEDAKRAEAMANLMRFYSPYAASPMGKPLGPLRPAAPAPTPTPAPVAPPPALSPVPASATETPRPVYPAFPPAQAQVPEPVTPTEVSPEARPEPGLIIETTEPTILSPSALVPPAVFASSPPAAPRPGQSPAQTVEVPRPMPARTQPQVAAAAEAQASWRDKLARPVPASFPPAATPAPAAPYHSPTRTLDEVAVDDDDLWDEDSARIALLAEEAEDDHPSTLNMLGSTVAWLIPSILGIVSLGGGAAAFYKSTDPVVVREGYYDFFFHTSIVLAVIGLVLVSLSIAMILRRLGGLKD
jgi:GH24 family phage-related lysozyme (muramidase)/uncharacterized protein YjbI with pentapeptide repeats